MAVIKSGSSTDQADVTPSKALKVDATATTQNVAVQSTIGSVGILNQLNAVAQVVIDGHQSTGVVIAAGTLSGMVVPEVSFDGGASWKATFFTDPTTGQTSSSLVFTNPNPLTSRTIVSSGGSSDVRIRVASYTSGSASATVDATSISQPAVLYAGPDNTPLAPNFVQMAGSDGTNTQALRASNANPVGTEFGLITRNIPSGTQSVSIVGSSIVDISDRAARLLGHVTVDNASIAVTGAFFQATQPVSIAASVAVTGTFFQATQPVSGTVTANVGTTGGLALGHVTVDNASIAVTGTFFQATQPVSGTVTANVGTTGGLALDSTLTGGTQKTKIVDTAGVNVAVVDATGDIQVDVNNFPATQAVAEVAADLAVTATGAAAASVTLTLPAVAGDFHYITMIEIVKYAAAAITGAATPVVVTSTDLPGAMAWTFDTAQAIGTSVSRVYVPAKPLKSSVANTPTTIVCPATTSVIWRINVWYSVAP
jgi:hypothetical protein